MASSWARFVEAEGREPARPIGLRLKKTSFYVRFGEG